MKLSDLDPGTVFATPQAPGERFVLVGREDATLAMCEHEGEPNHTAMIDLGTEVQILQLPGSTSPPAALITPRGGQPGSNDEPPLIELGLACVMFLLSTFGTLGWTDKHGFLPMGAFGAALTILALCWILSLTRESR